MYASISPPVVFEAERKQMLRVVLQGRRAHNMVARRLLHRFTRAKRKQIPAKQESN